MAKEQSENEKKSQTTIALGAAFIAIGGASISIGRDNGLWIAGILFPIAGGVMIGTGVAARRASK